LGYVLNRLLKVEGLTDSQADVNDNAGPQIQPKRVAIDRVNGQECSTGYKI
jgi:hypothetical protein